MRLKVGNGQSGGRSVDLCCHPGWSAKQSDPGAKYPGISDGASSGFPKAEISTKEINRFPCARGTAREPRPALVRPMTGKAWPPRPGLGRRP